ncbi:VPS70 [Candida oxycetoniae]|uniref:VPS70 n=1 Tax=Candida oxycetoniae TaxID=497107 RepID=A0AAI9T0E0_9ASCO|nr:VPS70 [Candida oxycetoniae]KAI3406122.1 VPS70 [Candida oxycetoniae]
MNKKVQQSSTLLRVKRFNSAPYFLFTVVALLCYFITQIPFSSFGPSLQLDIKDKDDNASIDPEQNVLQSLKINLASNWAKKYTAEAHLAGTNYPLVEWTEQKLQEFGFDTTIDPYEILVSYPKDHDLNLVDADGKLVYKAPLKEDVVKEDPTTYNDTVPTFLGYAANGNVTGHYVYANYGSKEDFKALKEHDIDVRGKIVVVRYGKIFRGLKVKFAQDLGAIGVLIYSDPGDDFGITPANGFKQYPKGPARQESSVQRGSVQFLGGEGSTPGDPTTPSYASKPGVERKDPHSSIGKIPALPISYREVKPILQKLNGHGAKISGFEGELDGFDYYTGPSKYQLNLFNEQEFKITTLWNVYGEIKGEKSNEVIILGNHRDAWIKGGAADPNSGSATLLEVARALGNLKRAGHKFKRTIILHSYDGEEYGLLGSTEQGEYFAEKYQRDVVAYLNLDVSVSGKNLNLGSSPVLNALLFDVAKKLDYPEGGSLYDHYVEKHHGEKIKTLGSGSDYTVYLEHLGIPSVDLGFTGGKDDPIYHYHSNYDSYHWMEKFGDKGFVYHNLAAKYLALLTLQLSEREIINFNLENYAAGLLQYYNETVARVPESWLNRSANSDRKEVEKEKKLDFEEYKYTKRITQSHYVTPICRRMQMGIIHGNKHHHHDESRNLRQILDRTYHQLTFLRNSTEQFDKKSELLQVQYDHIDELPLLQRIKLRLQIRFHNKSLKYFERNFLYSKGLNQRQWFKHIVFASGRYTGYAGQNFPGLNEAIEDKDFNIFVHWLHILNRKITTVANHLNNSN